MALLPLFLRMSGRRCLIIGAGPVAAGKIRAALKADADVVVRTREVSDQVAELAASAPNKVQITLWTVASHTVAEALARDEGMPWALVVAATDDAALNRQICEAAEREGYLTSSVTEAAGGNVVFPAIVDRAPVIAAFSTGGTSPALARHLRSLLESVLPTRVGRLAELGQRWRGTVKRRVAGPAQRRALWDRIFAGPIAEMIYAGREDDAEQAVGALIDESANDTSPLGEVYLVGAGPGDPELLTFRAMRLIQQADVVLYDRLVSDEILAFIRRDAERIYVGKQRAAHAVPQGDINQRLIDYARAGKRALRLKGGDPFVFGRGGEEIARLAEEGIPFQVVPGITAASGCAAYAGIPLTHRDHAQSCVFVTGYLKNGRVALEWERLVAPNQTIVVYMGQAGLSEICRELVAHGLPAHTPVALITDGTKATQHVAVGTLTELPCPPDVGERAAPALIIVGEVVSLHRDLRWFASGLDAAGI